MLSLMEVAARLGPVGQEMLCSTPQSQETRRDQFELWDWLVVPCLTWFSDHRLRNGFATFHQVAWEIKLPGHQKPKSSLNSVLVSCISVCLNQKAMLLTNGSRTQMANFLMVSSYIMIISPITETTKYPKLLRT